ncbi:MAG: hypothetical protein OEY75_08980, partial [Hylemonella sp.]|nr:hypothetical protein [Hylemonella sp.]
EILPSLVAYLEIFEKQKVLTFSGECRWNYSIVTAVVAGSNPAGAAMRSAQSASQHRSSVW